MIDRMKQDPPLVVMNLGAVLSLSGFMLTDIMALRLLSMSGSVCGMIYNWTRKPRQWEAVAWGLVFFTVNGINVGRLILERRETKFSQAEHFFLIKFSQAEHFFLDQIFIDWLHIKQFT